MKISGKQLEAVLYRLQIASLGYSSKPEDDYEINLSLAKEDPGNGSMIDCLTLKVEKTINSDSDKIETMIVEIYPASEQQSPRATKSESFIIKSKY